MLKQLDWIVIPGGPGMSSKYLEKALAKPFRDSRLHYYCIYGAPDSIDKDPDIEEMVEQIFHVAKKYNLSQFGFITHSFGNYLALRALEKNNDSIKALIMLNPMPFTFTGWKNALTTIVNKVPANILNQIDHLANKKDQGMELFRTIYPYYTGSENSELPINVTFDMKVCNSISAKIADFDDKNFVQSLTIPLARIVGEKDPFLDNKDILANQTIIISKAGHYPFFEATDEFAMAINKIGEILCR